MTIETNSPLEARWAFSWDMNADGLFTISDIGALADWLFFVPGDYAIYMTITVFPETAIFLELSASSYGGWPSGIISGLSFLCGFLIWGAVVEFFDRSDASPS